MRKSFAQFMAEQTLVYDEMIMSDIRPEDKWELFDGGYEVTLNAVRKLSEGLAYRLPGVVNSPMGAPVDITMDRFKSIWPNVTKPYKK